ncbi:MAG: DNA primase family protein [Methylomicrobium sp.]
MTEWIMTEPGVMLVDIPELAVNDPIISSENKNLDISDTISTDADSSSSDSAQATAQNDKKAKDNKLTDSRLAEKVADVLRDIIAIDETTGEWFMCKNGIWQPIGNVRATKIINKSLHAFLPEGFSKARLNAIEGFLKLYLSLEKWESKKTLLPLQNGVLDTDTMTLLPYSPEHKFNWQLPYEYDPLAEIKIINQWLWEVTNQDIEIINIVRAFFKITMVGGEVQKFLEIIGPGGTGKSTLIRLLIMLVGEANHTATDLKNLEQNRFEAATLYGKRLAVISDSSRYGGEVSVLKAITGGDPVRHERKNQQQNGAFVYCGTVVIASNEAIQSTDYSSGLARRRMPIAFVRKVTDEDKAKWRSFGGIEKAMQAELPGLLNWILAMTDAEVNDCLSIINGTLNKSQREHLIETNKLAAWIDDNLIVKENNVLYVGASTSGQKDPRAVDHDCNTKLYPNYLRWCGENGVQAIAVQRFSNNLVDIAEHCKLPVKAIGRDSNGRRVAGFKIRTISDGATATPITQTLLNAVQCQVHADTHSLESCVSADSAEAVAENSLPDMEVF